MPSLDAAVLAHGRLLQWLVQDALPLWDRHGVDRTGGGFFETVEWLGPEAWGALGEVRRGRVIARQLYVFATGQRLGWRSPLSNPISHGCDYLFARMHRGDGLFHTAFDRSTEQPRSAFNLYEHAFYLFALAHTGALGSLHYPIEETAESGLRQLRRHWGKSNGGFDESNPPSLPLKSNPHMHLLEAALAWIEVTQGAAQRPWHALADELITLCCDRLIDPRSGAIREYFDHDWRPIAGDEGRFLEPGHQFEWAWLLMRWADSTHCDLDRRSKCLAAARRLIEIGECHGIDPVRGAVVNEIWDDMSVKDAAAKLWPQTERLKAWCAMLDQAQDEAGAQVALRKIAVAADRLAQYFRSDSPGLWYEVWAADGRFVAGPSKASSFYHLVCAIDVLGQSLNRSSLGGSETYDRH